MNRERMILLLHVMVAAVACEASADVVIDSLCIVDEQGYQSGAGAYCGGREVFGRDYDLQVADDFRLPAPLFCTAITADFLTYSGHCPDEVCISFFPEGVDGCLPAPEAHRYFRIQPEGFGCEPFNDGVFGLRGVRLTTELEPVFLAESHWFTCVQPRGADWGYAVVQWFPDCIEDYGCSAVRRDGGERNQCCDGNGGYGHQDWRQLDDSSFQVGAISMRVEGIPAGDCSGGERVTAACKPGDGERLGKIVVKVRDGQPGGTVTALLDPPDPRHVSIPLDARGRGKGKFRDVDDTAAHRVFLCDAVLDVPCGR